MLDQREIAQVRTALLAHRGQLLGLQAQSVLRRFIRLYRKYDENQQRDDRGRWTDAGGEDPATTGSITPKVNNGYTGNLAIDSVSQKLLDKAADIYDELGPGTGPEYGTRFHKIFADRVKNAGMPGVEVEQSLIEGSVFPWGTPGSRRTDVLLRNYNDDAGQVLAIWDLKTGGAVLTPSRAAELRLHAGVGEEVPVFQLRIPDGPFPNGLTNKALALRSKSMTGTVDHVFIASPNRLTPTQWQSAIDGMNLIVRIVLDPDDVERMSGTIRATLDGKPVSLSFEERPVPLLAKEAGFSHLFAIPAEGPVEPTLTARIVALAYLIASNGAGYDPVQGIQHLPEAPPKDPFRELDSTLAIFCGRDAECRARYPEGWTSSGDEGRNAVVLSRVV